MNMVPNNAYIKPLQLDVLSLAASTGWTALHLPKGMIMLWSGDDQQGAFFVWRIPPVWRSYMALREPVPSEFLGLTPGRLVWLASAVIPMGWVLAVLVFQRLHRRLCLRQPPLGAGLPEDVEWRRDRPLPIFQAAPRAAPPCTATPSTAPTCAPRNPALRLLRAGFSGSRLGALFGRCRACAQVWTTA